MPILKTDNSNTDNIISVSQLYKSFGNVLAVDNLSFDVKRGSLFAFLGLNGAGKSTTINIICSILKKDSGTVLIDGVDIDNNSREVKSKIGIVFQDSVLDKQLTVKENLYARASLYSMTKKQAESRIETLSETFEITNLLKRNFGVLSGGQRRRIDIVRALLHSPKILILDEPTTGLDPNTRVKIWQVIEKLREEKQLTVFLTTHYMEESVRADNVVILDSGRLVAEGTPDKLKSEYTTDFVRLICSNNESNDKILQKTERKFLYRNNSYYVNVSDCGDALTFLNAHKSDFSDFEVLKGNMDDVFLNVTGKKLEVQVDES